MNRQNFLCAACSFDYGPYRDKVDITLDIDVDDGPYDSLVFNTDLNSRLMRKFKQIIPIEKAPEVDHVVAITLGGTAIGLNNHQVLCAQCHKSKTRSDLKVKYSIKPHPLKGKPFSESHIRKLSEVRKGFDSERRRRSRIENLYPTFRIPILAVNAQTGQEIIFNSLQEAADSLKLQISNISRVLGGKQNRKQHKGWTFKAI
jgi:hypothetical protein